MLRTRDDIFETLDPYNIACAVDAYLRELARPLLAAALRGAGSRLTPYYRTTIAEQLQGEGGETPQNIDVAEFERIVGNSKYDAATRERLIVLFKNNLRVIPLINGIFAKDIARIAKGHHRKSRSVAFEGLELSKYVRGGAFAIAALAGALGAHYYDKSVTARNATPSSNPAPNSTSPVSKSFAGSRIGRPRSLPFIAPPDTQLRVPRIFSASRVLLSSGVEKFLVHNSASLPPPGLGRDVISVPLGAPTPLVTPDLTDMPEVVDMAPNQQPSPTPLPPAIPSEVIIAPPKATASPASKFRRSIFYHLDPFKPPEPSATPGPKALP